MSQKFGTLFSEPNEQKQFFNRQKSKFFTYIFAVFALYIGFLIRDERVFTSVGQCLFFQIGIFPKTGPFFKTYKQKVENDPLCIFVFALLKFSGQFLESEHNFTQNVSKFH